jgi:hypothetical protein
MKTKQKAEIVKTKQKAEIRKQKSEGTRLVFRPILFLLSAFLICDFPAWADDVVFPIYLLTGTAATNRSVVVTPLALYPATNQVVAYDRVKFTTGTNGSFTVSNMTAGLYQMEVKAPPDKTLFSFVVATNGTGGAVVNVSTILVAATNATCPAQNTAYSMAASDARYSAALPMIGMVRGGYATFPSNAYSMTVTCTNASYPSGFTGPFAIVITAIGHVGGARAYSAHYITPSSFEVYPAGPYSNDTDFSWIAIQASPDTPYFSWP